MANQATDPIQPAEQGDSDVATSSAEVATADQPCATGDQTVAEA